MVSDSLLSNSLLRPDSTSTMRLSWRLRTSWSSCGSSCSLRDCMRFSRSTRLRTSELSWVWLSLSTASATSAVRAVLSPSRRVYSVSLERSASSMLRHWVTAWARVPYSICQRALSLANSSRDLRTSASSTS
ncbi:hypothetical protein CRUP_036111 [Coryphaenoides rupestris]|nr:hypothetical protein CRUP_036111 [Coryphaenoides rupestris]